MLEDDDRVHSLVAVTEAYAKCQYTDDASYTLGEIINMVEHCNKLFDYPNTVMHVAVERLLEGHSLTIRND